MTQHHDQHETEEIFFDHLKDQFAFFYALTVAGMDAYHIAKKNYQSRPGQDQPDAGRLNRAPDPS